MRTEYDYWMDSCFTLVFDVINRYSFNVRWEYLTQNKIFSECSKLVVEESTSINFLNESVSFIRFYN